MIQRNENRDYNFWFGVDGNKRLFSEIAHLKQSCDFSAPLYRTLIKNAPSGFIIDYEGHSALESMVDQSAYAYRIVFKDKHEAHTFLLRWIDKPLHVYPPNQPRGKTRYYQNDVTGKIGRYYINKTPDGWYHGTLESLQKADTRFKHRTKRTVMDRCYRHCFGFARRP